jgi:hypothetical protein
MDKPLVEQANDGEEECPVRGVLWKDPGVSPPHPQEIHAVASQAAAA